MPLTTLVRMLRPLTLSRALEVVKHVQSQNGRSPDWFDIPVEELIGLFGDLPVTDINPSHIDQWYRYIKQRPHRRKPGQTLSPWTIDHYGRALKAFFGHLLDMGHIDTLPTRRLKLPKLPRAGKRDISLDDIEKMVRASRRDWRDHAIVLVLKDSGVRVSGLVSMTTYGLEIESKDGRKRGRALVEAKGNKRRWIFFRHNAAEAIEMYLSYRPDNRHDALWLSKRGGTPLTRSGVYQMLERVAGRAGVEKFNPHGFRHALAKRLIDRGANPELVRDILGHEDVTTTLSMYVNYDEQELQDRHDQLLSAHHEEE